MPKKKKPAEFHCPNCGHKIDLSDYARLFGSLGGSVTGKSKARSSEQARAAVQVRWAKRKEKKQ